MATNFEPHECVIFIESAKIGTHENKGIHSNCQKSRCEMTSSPCYSIFEQQTMVSFFQFRVLIHIYLMNSSSFEQFLSFRVKTLRVMKFGYSITHYLSAVLALTYVVKDDKLLVSVSLVNFWYWVVVSL